MQNKNTVVVVDGGGRGAALVDAYGRSNHVSRIIAVPGNDLMDINTDKEVITHQDLKTTSVREIVEIAKREGVALVDVAQDNAVEAGVTDAVREVGITTFGPTRASGQIEWDKSWARDFGVRHKLPQPIFQSFSSVDDGIEFLNKQKEDKKWFIKAAGLAEGKGVLPAVSNKEAVEKIKELNENFKAAAETYLIEQWLEGEEFSSFAICDGSDFQIVGSAQDHKRVNDGDEGPNTGGMGCSTPPLVINENIKDQISEIFSKTIRGLADEKRPYTGILYLGGIIVGGRVYIIEFNARWGDPEAEVLLPGIKTDLFEVGMAVAKGEINNLEIETDGRTRVAVAATTRGYPGSYPKGKEITGIDEIMSSGVKVYGAGIKKQDGKYFTNGGRVLYVVGEGRDVIEARDMAYNAIGKLKFEDDMLHYRRDIGYRDVERLKKK